MTCISGLALAAAQAADEVLPHRQTKPPGPPLSPAEAIAKMTVPPGFQVELVACEPQIVNPVAMTFDERGRIWVTESFEYPRREPGPGRDRIKVMEDTDGDGQIDKQEVVVTGFGRDDTHELPNSLTWGPDGWLYGLNGVFNRSRVKHRGREYDFTCALFRIHPRTRDFELFCEGTSNPWGVAWDREGSAFISACVIDHLWHLT